MTLPISASFVLLFALCACGTNDVLVGSGGRPIGEEAYRSEVTRLHRIRALNLLDSDGDNELSHSEWKESQGKSGETLRDFNKVDKDGNGVVANEEVARYIADRVRVGKLSDSDVEYREAEPTYLKLKLFSFPLHWGKKEEQGRQPDPRANSEPRGFTNPPEARPIR